MSEPITIIGSDTVISGNLEGDEDLTVEGRVEGSITLSKTLTIEVGGVVRANINVRNAVISGVLVGNIEASEAVHLTEAGRMVGDITAPRVILVDGSSFRGNIDMGDFDVERDSSSIIPARHVHEEEDEDEDEDEDTEEEPEVRRAPAPPAAVTRVRRPEPVAARPVVRPAVRPAPAPAAKPVPRSAPVSSAKKAPPAPKARSVGKSKAIKKKR